MRVLITGASGFIGSELARVLGSRAGMQVRAAARNVAPAQRAAVEWVRSPELSEQSDWGGITAGADVVVHLAARVHVMRERAGDPLAEFLRVNVKGTLAMARQAAAAGVRRFIFLSSIKVNGETTKPGRPFTPLDEPNPQGPYAASKSEAERALQGLAAKTGMEVVIIRPPLVYGPGVAANFESMMRWIRRGVPLPLRAIRNLRSLVARGNLVDLIARCLDHPQAANRILFVADDQDLSTPDLLGRLGTYLQRPARLVYVPPSLLKAGATLVAMRAEYVRLCGSLQVDTSLTRTLLDWHPVVTSDVGLRETAEYYLAHRDGRR